MIQQFCFWCSPQRTDGMDLNSSLSSCSQQHFHDNKGGINPSVRGQVNGQNKQNRVCTYNRASFNLRMDVLTQATTWMNLQAAVPRKISPKPVRKGCVLSDSTSMRPRSSQIHRNRKWTGGCLGQGERQVESYRSAGTEFQFRKMRKF